MSTVSTSVSASVIAIAKSLVAKIFVRKEATKTIRTFSGYASNPKTKKGRVKRYTTSTVNLGYEVIDTAATVRARKDAYTAAINEALGIETHVKNCAAAKSKEAVEAAAFTAEMTALEADIARINTQLAKYKSFVPAHVGTINPANTEIKIGGPSAGARRKAKARTRAIAQAKRMNALSVVLRYSQQPNTTVLSVADAFVPSAIEYGTAISSLTTNTINSAVAIDIVCSADANASNNPSRSAMSQNEDSPAVETNLEVAENLVKHCDNDNHSEGSSMYITELFADLIFPTATKSIRVKGETAEKAAAKAAKKAEARNNFIAKFADKLVAPDITNVGIVGNKTGRGLQGVNTKVKEFIFNSFECYGLISDEDQLIDAKVKCNSDFIAYPKTDDVNLDIVIYDGMQLFSYVVAYATGNLTVEDKIEFCLAISNNNPDVKAFKNGIIISDVSFNFANGVVLSGTTERIANPLVDILKVNFTGEHAVFLLALTALRAGKAVKYLVNQAVSLFQRDENYGAKLSEFDLANGVARNLDLATDFIPNTAHGKFPFFAIKAGKQNDGKLADILARGEMAVVDKYNMKWAAKGIGAEAVLVGRNGNIVYNLNDASKTAKVYNRPASIKYTFANMKDRVKSHFAVALSDGTFAYSCGKKLNTAWTSSKFGHGSGVAVINPALTFDFEVGKSIRGVFNTLSLPATARKGIEAKELTEKVRLVIVDKIEKAVGKVFAPNQSIIELNAGDSRKTILTNTNKAVNIRVLSGVALVTTDNEIDIKLNVEIVGKDEQYVKLRGIGKKCTTLPYEVDGIDADWDIILNIEAVKGYPALVEMYANSFKADCFYNSNAGTLTTPDGVVDLKEKTNALTEWACANTHETIISFEMARSCYQDLAGCIDPHAVASLEELQALIDTGKGPDTYVEDINETTVRIHERVECIMGEVVFDVEVSTPKESVSTTHLTMEAACGLLLQDKALGETLLKEVADKAKTTKALVKSFIGGTTTVTFDVTNQSGRDEFRKVFGSVAPAARTGFANHRAVLNELAKNAELRDGFKITWNNGKLGFEVHPAALAAFGGFSNGSATREIADVINFIYFVTSNIEELTSVDALVAEACNTAATSITRWSSMLAESANCLKKFTRSGKLIGGKVRTTYNPILNNRVVNGVELPVVAINPNGNFAKLLKAEEGDIVGITRTPMPFMTAAILTYSTDVPDAHVWVSPKVWHASNEGDSDGDGITLMHLTRHGVDSKRAAAINESIMGPQGYHFVYGDNLPIYDFSNHDDKWGNKKSTKVWDKAIVSSLTVEEYGAGAALVSTHYKYNVGISYAMCSQLIFAAANKLYQAPDSDEFKALLEATVIAWRLIYEGLGLSGYSPKAKEFFQLLNVLAFDFKNCRAFTSNKPGHKYIMPWTVSDVKAEGYLVKEQNGITELRGYIQESTEFSTAALVNLVRSRAICMTYRKIENKGVDSFSKKDARGELRIGATIVGAFRRLGQGNDPVEVLDTMTEVQENQESGDKSIFTIYNDDNAKFSKFISCPALRTVMSDGVALHAALRVKFQEIADTAFAS